MKSPVKVAEIALFEPNGYITAANVLEFQEQRKKKKRTN